MANNLNNAPPIRSNWRLGEYDRFVAGCQDRHEAAKARWLAIHADAGLTLRERAVRAFRGMIGRK